MAEINEKLLNLSFRNFTNINGEDPNVFVGKRRKEKRIIPFFIKVSLILLALTAKLLSKHSTLPSLTSFFSEQPAQSSQRRNQKRKAEKHRRKEKAVEKDHGWP